MSGRDRVLVALCLALMVVGVIVIAKGFILLRQISRRK